MLFSSLALILSLAGACAAPTPADATSTSAASASTSSPEASSAAWAPGSNKTAPAVTLPLADPPVFDKPNQDNWRESVPPDTSLADPYGSDSGPIGVDPLSRRGHHHLLVVGKDHVNGSLGAVALLLANANKSLLAEDTVLIVTDDSMSNATEVVLGMRLNSSNYAVSVGVGANYTIKMVRDSNHSMVFAESKLFPIKPVGLVPAASGAAAARSAGFVTACAACMMAAAAMVV